jgi:PAS domain S-box-containing protein
MKTTDPVQRCINLLAAMEGALQVANIPIIITEAGLKRPGPRILFANRAFCASTRYSEKELIGQTQRILQAPRTDQELLARLAERLKNGEPFAGQTINYRKDGTPYMALVEHQPDLRRQRQDHPLGLVPVAHRRPARIADRERDGVRLSRFL